MNSTGLQQLNTQNNNIEQINQVPVTFSFRNPTKDYEAEITL